MDDINRYFEILGLKPGASIEEVKEAYKDLVKVWHPDRFAHDPKLQQKAQEKLKEINEAYQKIQDFLNNYYKYQESFKSDSGQSSQSEENFKSYAERQSTTSENKDYSSSQPPPKKSEKKSKFWSFWRLLLWWKIDQDELARQIAEYQTLKITQSARGQSFLLLLFSAVLTSLVIVLGTWDSINFVDVFIICLLGYFIFRGHKWAMIGAMIYLSLSKFYLAYEGLQTHSSQTYAHLAWWAIYMHFVYLAFKVERLRNKGNITENVSKKSRNVAAWIIGIIGLSIVASIVIFKVHFDSFKQSSPMDDCILKYQKEAKCQRASAIINLACRGKYSDTVTGCILKNIGDAQTDMAAISILRSCQNKYPVEAQTPAPATKQTDDEWVSYDEWLSFFKNAQTPAPAPTPAPVQATSNAPEREDSIFIFYPLVVIDKMSGLMWARDANLATKEVSWGQAKDFIFALNEKHYAGFSDWRLPDEAELETLVIYAKRLGYGYDGSDAQKNRTIAVALNKAGFINVIPYFYWTATISETYIGGSVAVGMWNGNIGANDRNKGGHVLPVRDGR